MEPLSPSEPESAASPGSATSVPSGSDCPVTYCLAVIGGKWKPVVLYLIANDVNRFGVLQRSI
ncbi:MAG: hypothetical protein AAF531_27440, partial [Actinomycetota bacterium]